MFINSIGNFKIGANDKGTEKLNVDGIAIIRVLPQNGAANAHHTINGDDAFATQRRSAFYRLRFEIKTSNKRFPKNTEQKRQIVILLLLYRFSE